MMTRIILAALLLVAVLLGRRKVRKARHRVVDRNGWLFCLDCGARAPSPSATPQTLRVEPGGGWD